MKQIKKYIKHSFFIPAAILFVSLITAPLTFAGAIYTWTNQTSSGSHSWDTISSSSTGQYLVAGYNGGYLYTSNNYGATWTAESSSGSNDWIYTAVSSSGQYQVAVPYGGDIVTSNNYGATWTAQTTPGTASWWGVALSSNGSQLAVSTYGGDIWTGTIAYPGITNQTVGLTANGSATVSVLNGVTGSPDSTTLAILSGPAHGNATVSSGSIIYKPNSAYAGTDSLAYQVCSSVISTVCSQATLTFDITTATVNPPDTGFGKTVRTNNIMTLLIYSTMTISLVVVGFVIRKLPQKK